MARVRASSGRRIPCTIAYVARLVSNRYAMQGVLDERG